MSGFTIYQDPISNIGDKIVGTTNPFPTQSMGGYVKPVTLLPTTNLGATLPLTGTPQPPNLNKTLRITVSGTGTISLQIQSIMDGITNPKRVWDNINGGYVSSNTITAFGEYDIDVQGYDNIQAYLTALSGTGATIVVTGRWLAV